METYHELIQLYQKLLAITKFLFSSLVNICRPHRQEAQNFLGSIEFLGKILFLSRTFNQSEDFVGKAMSSKFTTVLLIAALPHLGTMNS